jgi:hypothetical protein
MSSTISALLLLNLNDVFGENDPVRRRAAIDEIYRNRALLPDSVKLPRYQSAARSACSK